MLVEIWRADQLVPVAIYFGTTPQPCNAAVTVELVISSRIMSRCCWRCACAETIGWRRECDEISVRPPDTTGA